MRRLYWVSDYAYYGHTHQVLLVEASDEASWSGWAAVALWAYESCRAFLRWNTVR